MNAIMCDILHTTTFHLSGSWFHIVL